MPILCLWPGAGSFPGLCPLEQFWSPALPWGTLLEGPMALDVFVLSGAWILVSVVLGFSFQLFLNLPSWCSDAQTWPVLVLGVLPVPYTPPADDSTTGFQSLALGICPELADTAPSPAFAFAHQFPIAQEAWFLDAHLDHLSQGPTLLVPLLVLSPSPFLLCIPFPHCA